MRGFGPSFFTARTPSARPRPCHRHKRSSSNMVEILGCTTRTYFEGKRKVTTAPLFYIPYSLFLILITTWCELEINRNLVTIQPSCRKVIPSHTAVPCMRVIEKKE